MVVDEVSFIVIAKGHELRNLGRWSWIILQVNNNERTRIITEYCPIVSASAGGSYRKQLEALAIMKIQNYPRT